MPKPERRDPAKEQRWRLLLGLWRRSGLTGREFCAERGLNESNFYAWRRELDRRDQEKATARAQKPLTQGPSDGTGPAFLKVTIAGAPATAAIEVVVGQGRVLRVGPGFDADLLRQLMRLLEEPSC